ncbi:MAG TPA: hypothetical protein VHW65_07035 [Gemmatimonadales bacterium]|nr:hypothetical protein [Gemmatimonadales bacterium]
MLCWHAPLACQSNTHVDSLIHRVELGDAAARKQLAAMARPMIIDAAQHSLSPADANRLAQIALTLAAPLGGPEDTLTAREAEWRRSAVRALRSALADSSDVWAVLQLEAIMPYPYLWQSASKELQQLRALTQRIPSLPVGLTEARMHLELEVGSLDSAARVLVELQAAHAQTARLDHLVAELDLARGDTAHGLRAYYAGAGAIADTGGLRDYTWDIFWIAEASELAEWRALPMSPGTHEEWLRAFWTRRDLDDGRDSGARLVEQFRRWRLALAQYRWDLDGSLAEGIPDDGIPIYRMPITDPTHNPIARWHASSRVLDDRGSLVMRHGDPIRLPSSTHLGGLDAQNLAWQTLGGRLVVGFGRPSQSERFGMVARNFPAGNPMVTCQFDARMCEVAIPLASIALRDAKSRIIAEDYYRQREAAEHSDGNAVTFRDSLGAIVQAFGVAHGGTLVVLAIPAAKLSAGDSVAATAGLFRAHLRVMVGDSAAGKIVAVLDTTRSWRSTGPVTRDAWLTAYTVIPTPPGDWSVTVTVGDTAHTLGTGRRFSRVPSPAFDGSTLALSDPIVGREGGGLVWHHDGTAIPLNPTNAWRTTESVIVNYSIDGMIAGHAYETQFELWPLKGKPKAPGFTVGFTSAATQTTTAVQREFSPRNLTPGEYRLVVRVRDSVTGAEVSRDRLLAILK